MTCTKISNKHDFTQRACLWIILVALLAVTVLCFSNGISGNDFWWHIKVGEWVVEHNEVPTTDIFSWYGTEKGIAWTAHEWLADVIFYAIYASLGSVGIFVFCVAAALGMLFLMLREIKPHLERNYLLGGLFLLLFAVVASLFFYGRPHLFSYFLLFFELKILYEFSENSASKKIYFIPLIAVLWSNLHGGSSNLSYLLCLMFLLSGCVNISYGRVEAHRWDRKAAMKLAAVMVGAVAAILINPIGLRVLTYPYINLSDGLSMSLISEWQAPDAKVMGNLILYFFPILFMSFGLVCGTQKIKGIDLLVMLAFLFLFFRSARFITLWYIAAVFYAAPYLPDIRISQVTKKSEKIAVLSLIVLLLIPCGMGIADTVQTHREGQLISTGISDEAICVVKEDAPKRIYNDYNLGEALIYHEIPVFFDARADLYAQENILADGASLMYLESVGQDDACVDVDAILDKYDFDAMLLLKQRSLYAYVMDHPERFVLIYEDDEVGYFDVLGGQGHE